MAIFCAIAKIITKTIFIWIRLLFIIVLYIIYNCITGTVDTVPADPAGTGSSFFLDPVPEPDLGTSLVPF
jgi:hypothetical protein